MPSYLGSGFPLVLFLSIFPPVTPFFTLQLFTHSFANSSVLVVEKNYGFFFYWSDYCAAELFDHASQDKFYCLLDNEFDGVAAGMTDASITRRYNSMLSRKILPSASKL